MDITVTRTEVDWHEPRCRRVFFYYFSEIYGAIHLIGILFACCFQRCVCWKFFSLIVAVLRSGDFIVCGLSKVYQDAICHIVTKQNPHQRLSRDSPFI